MKLSRRDALRAGGGLLAGGAVAGCVERRVTRVETNVESSTTWALSPATGDELDAEAFESYVAEMETEYGDSGVWGESDAPSDGFVTAHVQRLPVLRESSGQPGGGEPTLRPDDIDRNATAFPVVDAAVVLYDVDGEDRYWLWAAVDVRDETFAGDAPATVLSAGVSLRNGRVTDTGDVSADDGTAAVDLAGKTVRRFPLDVETTDVGTGDRTGEAGYYVVEWEGAIDGVQSVNGVVDATRDGEYDLAWSVGAGYRRVQRR
jgi:hypothetical protein